MKTQHFFLSKIIIKWRENFQTVVSGSGSDLEKIMDPDPACPERLDLDPVCSERFDPDPM